MITCIIGPRSVGSCWTIAGGLMQVARAGAQQDGALCLILQKGNDNFVIERQPKGRERRRDNGPNTIDQIVQQNLQRAHIFSIPTVNGSIQPSRLRNCKSLAVPTRRSRPVTGIFLQIAEQRQSRYLDEALLRRLQHHLLLRQLRDRLYVVEGLDRRQLVGVLYVPRAAGSVPSWIFSASLALPRFCV